MSERNHPMLTLREFVAWCRQAPRSTTIAAPDLEQILAPFVDSAPPSVQAPAASEATWRERLWTCPPETRIGVAELCEALGRPKSFAYRHTSERAAGADRIPHRKLDGELVFVVSEIRQWIADHEEIIEAPHAPARQRVAGSRLSLT